MVVSSSPEGAAQPWVPPLQGLPCFLTIEPRALSWAIAVRPSGAAESERSAYPDANALMPAADERIRAMDDRRLAEGMWWQS